MVERPSFPLTERYIVDALLIIYNYGTIKEGDFYYLDSNYATAAKIGRMLMET